MIQRLFLLGIGLLALWGCAHSPKLPLETWAKEDPPLAVRESGYLDLHLRILALELNQQAAGEPTYFIQFLPQISKIEGVCVFHEKTRGEPKLSDWQERLDAEVTRLETGIQESLSGLAMAQGYDSKKNLEIRFQIEGLEAKEVAIFRGGELHWLLLPSPMGKTK